MACFVFGELAHHDRRRGRTIRFPPKKADLFIQLSSEKKDFIATTPFIQYITMYTILQ